MKGKMKESGLTEIISLIWPPIWGQYPVFWGSDCSLMAAKWQLFFSFLSILRHTSSPFMVAAITDDCDILVYWYGREYCISQFHTNTPETSKIMFDQISGYHGPAKWHLKTTITLVTVGLPNMTTCFIKASKEESLLAGGSLQDDAT